MRLMAILILLVFGFEFVAIAGDSAYYDRMARIEKQTNEEIARNHELKKLELQYKIYCKELDMQKDNQYNISISSPKMDHTSDIDIRNRLENRVNQTIQDVKFEK